MNYLAHLYLAQPGPSSRFGNLLGDFMRGSRPEMFSHAVQRGLANHRWVDKFTDSHVEVTTLKQKVSPARRRFAGIIVDIAFDHFLIKNWATYSVQPLDPFCQSVYRDLSDCLSDMPVNMQHTVKSMTRHQWLTTYGSLQGVARALDNTASRIRFTHNFYDSITEIEANYANMEAAFHRFFPQLKQAVSDASLENPDEIKV
ncbi:DUF479 domain-containing protein [Salinimonas sp. HHU 13199]|uniref:DUF479 domain-containing protein n=1 Tax=Salinimonas profundi TaxID=2729140 RepID=A0ABR8LIK2_9ALTE|nr:ACP phosphodiesterase [Salinimonas profundi]MBD3585043.1 DUF479 domain-containing protein [Salinimonas profundi]